LPETEHGGDKKMYDEGRNAGVIACKTADRVKTAFMRLLHTGIMIAIGICLIYPAVFTLADSFMADWEINEYYGAREGAADVPAPESASLQLKLIPYELTFRQYYTVLVGKTQYLFMFWNSAALVLPIVLGQLVVGAMAAYAFAIMKSRLADFLFFLYVIVMLLPFQVTLVPNYLMADRLGILDTGLSIILPGVFGTFGVFLLRQYMVSVPVSYMEAAKIDGAGQWKIFTDIVVPMLKPGLAALFVLLFIDNWNMVEQPLIFLQDPLKTPLSVFLSYINTEECGVAFAASFIYMIPMVLVFLYGKEDMVAGMEMQLAGIKG
jgi:multiple sugar transport system permease protein